MNVHGPRERLLQSAIELMCERGVHATGLTDLLEHSNTARASIYKHFPSGKSDLMEQATYEAGRRITTLLDELLAARTPTGAVVGIFDYWKQVLIDSDFAMGCPILAAAQSGPQEPGVEAAAAEVFAAWRESIAASLTARRVNPTTAAELASLIVSSVEGATAQSRSAQSTQPLDDARTTLVRLIGDAVQAGALS